MSGRRAGKPATGIFGRPESFTVQSRPPFNVSTSSPSVDKAMPCLASKNHRPRRLRVRP